MSSRSNRRRPAVLAALLVLVLGVLVAACGGDDEESSEPTSGKATGEITVWAPGVEGEKLPELAKDFERENPGVKVNVTPVAIEQAHNKILTSIAGNKTPDVAWVGSTWMAEFAKTGALDEVPDSIDLEQFFQGAQDAVTVDDKAYGVPWHVETRVLYYRTDIAEKAGITKAPETWDELKETARAMKEKGGAKYGINLSSNNWQEWAPFVWQNGGEIAEGDQYTLDSPEAVEATAFYQSFFDEKLTPPSTQQGFDITPAFVRGTHPMFISGPWHMGLIDEAGGKGFEKKYTVAPLPENESGTSFVGGGELVVFKNAKNRDAAWKFVEYLTKPEVQAKFFKVAADLPSNQAAWEQPELAEDSRVKVFGEQLEDAKTAPVFPKWEQYALKLNDSLDETFTSGKDPAEATKEFQAAAEETGTQ
jgi:multiple sugar transport system substrate-binding protein